MLEKFRNYKPESVQAICGPPVELRDRDRIVKAVVKKENPERLNF